jgi:hypothetical protein
VAGLLAGVLAAGRLPRASPDPRVLPNEPKAGAGLLAGAAGVAAASAGTGAGADESAGAGTGAPDFSLSDMSVFLWC